jgi:voltage-gated potassium channel
MMDYRSHVKIAILCLFSVVAISVIGYMIIENMSFVDALYMAVITLTTVGFREVKELSEAGKIFTIIVIILGVAGIAYSLRIIVEFVLYEKIGERWRIRKMNEKINKLENHYIICGYGRIGEEICKQFIKTETPFVVIERNPEIIEEIKEEGLLYVEGSAEENEILLKAGIERAKGLLSVLPSDADNVFVALSAKSLNPKIMVATRATDMQAEEKLRKAGADKVICPYTIGGRRLAAMVLKPTVIDFLDTVVSAGNLELQMEEIQVGAGSEMVGKALVDTQIRQGSGAIIVAILDHKSHLKVNPSPKQEIFAEDVLIALGTSSQLKRLKEMARQ